jgi:hypothetical protein
MNNEKVELRGRTMNSEKKTCVDCLYCKVSAQSTKTCRICFCAKIGKKATISELYWLNKTVCKRFEDMSA